MFDRANVIYRYDGSFDGMLCCVFESYIRREEPMDILPQEVEQGTLFSIRDIPTEREKADRIRASIPKKMGLDSEYLVANAFLNGLPGKEKAIYDFICLGYRYGAKTPNMLGNNVVAEIQHRVLAVGNEAHFIVEFLRFAEYNGCLVALIEPKHFILPKIKKHFCSRFPEERFLIFDETHGAALLYQPYESRMIDIDELELPEIEETEACYQGLWKQYYDDIAIEQRYNPKCRMTHMAKRYWPHMLEVQKLTTPKLQDAGKRLKLGEGDWRLTLPKSSF